MTGFRERWAVFNATLETFSGEVRLRREELDRASRPSGRDACTHGESRRCVAEDPRVVFVAESPAGRHAVGARIGDRPAGVR